MCSSIFYTVTVKIQNFVFFVLMLQITDILLKAGSQVNGRDIYGDTPLHITASNGFINGLQMLMKVKNISYLLIFLTVLQEA